MNARSVASHPPDTCPWCALSVSTKQSRSSAPGPVTRALLETQACEDLLDLRAARETLVSQETEACRGPQGYGVPQGPLVTPPKIEEGTDGQVRACSTMILADNLSVKL